MKNTNQILTSLLAAILISFASLSGADALSKASIGSLYQLAQGEDNTNRIAIASGHALASSSGSSLNLTIGSISQDANGSVNKNIISIGGFSGSNVNADLIHQTAGGHRSMNELIIGEGMSVNISLGSVIQEANNGEVNSIRIGSSMAD